MNSLRLIAAVVALVSGGLSGCATSVSSDRQPPINAQNDLQRLQSQIYDAATGPNHVGSVYNKK